MKLSRLKLFATVIFIFGVITLVDAQQSDRAEENSLLAAALKKSETAELKSVFYIDKSETTIDAVKKVPLDQIKYVMVLTGDDIKKKLRAKGFEQVVMITTKNH